MHDIRTFLSRHLIGLSVTAAALMLVAAGGLLAWQAYAAHAAVGEVQRVTAAMDALIDASTAQARERGLTLLHLGRRPDGRPGAEVDAARARAEQEWQRALRLTDAVIASNPQRRLLKVHRRRLRADWRRVQSLRGRIRQPGVPGAGRGPPAPGSWLQATTRLIRHARTLHRLLGTTVEAPGRATRRALYAQRAAWTASEHSGRVRGIMAYYVAARRPVDDRFAAQLETSRAAARRARAELQRLAGLPQTPRRIGRAIEQLVRDHERRYTPVERGMLSASRGRYPVSAEKWFRLASEHIAAQTAVSTAASRVAVRSIRDVADRRLQLGGGYGLLSLAAAVLGLVSFGRVRRNADELYRHKDLAEITLRSIGDGLITTDPEGRIEYINPVAAELTGWSAGEAAGRPVREVFNLRNHLHESLTDPVGTCLEEGLVTGLTSGHRLVGRNGREIPVEDTAAPLRDRHGRIVGCVLLFYDVSHPDAQSHLLSYHATTDALTGLTNRREFERQLDARVRDAQRDGEGHVLAYIDLDQFKVVNDTCGHSAGDQLLRQVGFVLARRTREGDTLARLGGDEFGLLLRDCDLEQGARVAEELARAVKDFRFSWKQRVFTLGTSIGVTAISPLSRNATEALSQADASCYAAKEKGRSRVEIYHPDESETQAKRAEMEWISEVTEALHEDRLLLQCQAIAPLGDGVPAAEFTVRLRTREGTIVPPMAFIPAAERYNLMPDVDRWIIDNVCAVLSRCTAARQKEIVTINLSGSSLSRPDLAAFIRERTAAHGIPPRRICFEITETAAVAELNAAAGVMADLRRDGFTFALDDFGSGAASFSYLATLPVDLIKIDGAFVRRMADDPLDRAIVESIIHVTRKIGAKVCAEMVESASQLDELRAMGIDYVQGYAIGHPCLVEACMAEAADPGTRRLCCNDAGLV